MQQLLQLFQPSFDFIVADTALNPDWETRSAYRLTAAELIRTWADPTKIIGIRSGTETNKFGFDIDRGSDYHPYNSRENWNALLYHLEQIGLSDPVFICSSKSQGMHIYYIFSEPVNSFQAAARVYMHLVRHRLTPAPGQIEIFPNTKNYDSNYKPLRLPFQHGSELLDIDGYPLVNEHNVSPETRMEYLVSQIEQNQNDLKLFRSGMARAYTDYKKTLHTGRSPRTEAKTELWERNWRDDIAIGWTGRGQTNQLLHTITGAAIVFEGITNFNNLCAHVKTIVLTTPGYQRFCNHQHQIDRRIRGWARWCLYRRKYFPLPSRFGTNGDCQKLPRPSSSKRSDGVIAKIQRAINSVFERLGELPKKLTDRLAAIMSAARDLGEGISKNTLYRSAYKPLWQEAETAENRQLTETQSEKEFSHILPEKFEDFEEENWLETQSESEVSHISAPMELYSPMVPDLQDQFLTISTEYYNSRVEHVVTRQPEQSITLTAAVSNSEKIPSSAVPKPVDTITPPPALSEDRKLRPYQPQKFHAHSCQECQCPTPISELERWAMCRFCTPKNLWRQQI